MSPYQEINSLREIPKVIKRQLSDTDKARLYNRGGGVVYDEAGTLLNVLYPADLDGSIRGKYAQDKKDTLIEIKGKHGGEKQAKINLKIFDDATTENAKIKPVRRGRRHQFRLGIRR